MFSEHRDFLSCISMFRKLWPDSFCLLYACSVCLATMKTGKYSHLLQYNDNLLFHDEFLCFHGFVRNQEGDINTRFQ